MLTKEKAKKLLSLGTHNQLTKLLYTLDHVTSNREIAKAHAKLQDSLCKIFRYCDIFEFHTDHLIELAEILVGLYPERDNLEDYTKHILAYVIKKIHKHQMLEEKYRKQLQQKARYKENDPDGYLDLKYKTWTYTDGYYHQQVQMYRLLNRSLSDLLLFEAQKGRKHTCQKKSSD